MAESLPVLPPNHAANGSHDLRNQTIQSKQVVIGGGSGCDRLLGCTFIDCEIRIKCSGRMTGVALANSKFVNCTIWPSKIQNIPSLKPDFESCTFKGSYEIGFYGELTGCSFAAAKVNHALFFRQPNLSPQSVPPWPHVVIDGLDKNGADFMSTVPKTSLLWFAARKHPQVILANLETECDDWQQAWDLLKDKEYVWCRNQ